MREYERIRAAIIRGGTSKGVYLLANELPQDPARRNMDGTVYVPRRLFFPSEA
jgi:2-methylaconitate cis-trans-isomerase PrpF